MGAACMVISDQAYVMLLQRDRFAEFVTKDYGFMYQRSFHDLDGHLWEAHAADDHGRPRRGLIFFPLLFLTPNFVPREMLAAPMEAATVNPVTYLMEALRSLILEPLDWGAVLPGFAVVAGLGALMLGLTVRMIKTYD